MAPPQRARVAAHGAARTGRTIRRHPPSESTRGSPARSAGGAARLVASRSWRSFASSPLAHKEPSMRLRVLIFLACLAAPAPAQQPASPIAALAQSREADSLRLRRLIALHWDYTMREYPEFATAVGYSGQNARWTDNSAGALAGRKRELNEPLAVLQSIDRARLPAADQLNYDLFRRDITDAIEESRFP